jgi:polyphosphate kinase 2
VGHAKIRTRDPVEIFDLDAPRLPAKIDKGALRSGAFPYEEKLESESYEKRMRPLQIELVRMQNWVRDAGERVVIVFEGRDAAGKGGAIQTLTRNLNPRGARVVALAKPTDAERGQWYFQRYVHHMPTRGEITIFDRSWYNRAMVEPVNGFCTEQQCQAFLREAPAFERMLIRDGVVLIKIFLDIGREMQLKRLWKRRHDPLKQWKLSPIDFEALKQWPAYSQAIEHMFAATHVPEAPWTVVLANDKRRARLAVVEHILTVVPMAQKNAVPRPDKKIVGEGGHFFDQD